MKVYRLKKNKNLSHAVDKIAFTIAPAIEQNMVYLSKEGKRAESNIFFNEEKRMIYSPVLIPEQRIDRVNDAGEKFQIFFDAETIEEARKDFMIAKTPLSSFNHEHTNEVIKGISVVENWLIADEVHDKSVKLGYNLPVGTWMIGAHIDNEETISKIKSKEYNGISMEGLFSEFELVEEVNLSKSNNNIMTKLEKQYDDIKTMLSNLLPTKQKFASLDVGEGKLIYTSGEFTKDAMVFFDEAMTMPAEGTFTVEGKTIVIEAGAVTSITEAPVENSMEFAEDVSQLAEIAKDQAGATIESAKKIESLESTNKEQGKELVSLKKQLEEVITLSKQNEEKLKKVELGTTNSVTKLSTSVGETSLFQKLKATTNLN